MSSSERFLLSFSRDPVNSSFEETDDRGDDPYAFINACPTIVVLANEGGTRKEKNETKNRRDEGGRENSADPLLD